MDLQKQTFLFLAIDAIIFNAFLERLLNHSLNSKSMLKHFRILVIFVLSVHCLVADGLDGDKIPMQHQDLQIPSGGELVSIRITYSPLNSLSPLIIISLDLKENAATMDSLSEEWARSGYFVVGITHNDPNATGNAWVDANDDKQLWNKRAGDVNSAIAWVTDNSSSGRSFAGMVKTNKIGVAGHGFGGLTVANMAGLRKSFGFFSHIASINPAIKAILLLGTPANVGSAPTTKQFFDVKVPMLLISGGFDTVCGLRVTDEDRSGPFDGTPSAIRYLNYPTCSNRDIVSEKHTIFPDVAKLTSDLWKACLSDDANARTELLSFQPLGALTKTRE